MSDINPNIKVFGLKQFRERINKSTINVNMFLYKNNNEKYNITNTSNVTAGKYKIAQSVPKIKIYASQALQASLLKHQRQNYCL